MSKRLIFLGGILNAIGAAFHLVIGKVAAWPETLACLSDVNRGTVYVLNNHVMLAIAWFAIASFFWSRDLLTTSLGRATAAGIGLFFAIRAVEEVLYYQTLAGPGIFIIIYSALLSVLYWAALILEIKHKSINESGSL